MVSEVRDMLSIVAAVYDRRTYFLNFLTGKHEDRKYMEGRGWTVRVAAARWAAVPFLPPRSQVALGNVRCLRNFVASAGSSDQTRRRKEV